VNVDPDDIPGGTVMALRRPSGALTCMMSPDVTPGGNVTVMYTILYIDDVWCLIVVEYWVCVFYGI